MGREDLGQSVRPATPASILRPAITLRQRSLDPQASKAQPGAGGSAVGAGSNNTALPTVPSLAASDIQMMFDARLTRIEDMLERLLQKLDHSEGATSQLKAGAHNIPHRSLPSGTMGKDPRSSSQRQDEATIPHSSPLSHRPFRTDAQPTHPLQHIVDPTVSPSSSVGGTCGSPMDIRRQESRKDYEHLARFVAPPSATAQKSPGKVDTLGPESPEWREAAMERAIAERAHGGVARSLEGIGSPVMLRLDDDDEAYS